MFKNVAAVRAFVEGDIGNFLVANEPGGLSGKKHKVK